MLSAISGMHNLHLERIQVLEVTYPTLYRRLRRAHFLVKDRAGAVFAGVAGDLKLEQSQNRFSQGPGGHVIVGSAGDASVVAEFALPFLFHFFSSYLQMFGLWIIWKHQYNMSSADARV